MISSTEYEILSSLSTTPEIDEQAYQMELKTLIKERLISHNVTGETYSQIIYHGFLVTSLGKRAIEEYESFLQSKHREENTLEIAQEANAISKEANALSEKSNIISEGANALSQQANQTSKKATTLSGWAFAVSLLGFLLSVATFILSFFKNNG